MLIVLKIIAALILAAAIAVAVDMLIFRKRQRAAENPTEVGTHAGGILYVDSNRTYYKMRSGAVRKIADYRMDLRPGSYDMQRFTAIMDQAAKEHAEEVAETKMAADKAMRDVAKEEAGRA